jgi:hypothetical protein
VKTQIWVAVSVYVLVAIVRKRLELDASLYLILQIFSVTLFEKTPMLQVFQEGIFQTCPFLSGDATTCRLPPSASAVGILKARSWGGATASKASRGCTAIELHVDPHASGVTEEVDVFEIGQQNVAEAEVDARRRVCG